MGRMCCSLFALVALAFCDVVAAQHPMLVPQSSPALQVVCNEPAVAECNVTTHAIVEYGYEGKSTVEEKCKAVADFEDCITKYAQACPSQERSVWVREQTKLQEELNLAMGADCSSTRLSGHAMTEGSSGDSGSTSSGSSGFDQVSSGAYYWQWLVALLCLCTCCAGGLVGFGASLRLYPNLFKKAHRGVQGQGEVSEDEEDEEEGSGEYYDEEEPMQQTEAQAIQMASPVTQEMGPTGNALETGMLEEGNLQSNPTASMTMADPTYMPNTGYAPEKK